MIGRRGFLRMLGLAPVAAVAAPAVAKATPDSLDDQINPPETLEEVKARLGILPVPLEARLEPIGLKPNELVYAWPSRT